MKVAFLFNSDSPDIAGYYGLPVMEKIIDAGALQKEKRHMRISLGDVMTYGRVPSLEVLRSVYEPSQWDRRKKEALEATHNKATVYSWVFQNIPLATAEELHEKLLPEPSYLGAMDLDYTYLPHFAFFANGMIEKYRLHNNVCYLFYSMGEDEGMDVVDQEVFSNGGYQVRTEDIGGRHTIFDNYYDSIEHHNRAKHFTDFFTETLDWNDDDISLLTLSLEELHPYLFNILYASSTALESAEIKEQLSQAYLSGRRFIEHTADFLYPPQKKKYVGRDGQPRAVTKSDYINRIAAYLETTLIATNSYDKATLSKLGEATADLYGIFCRGVHKPFSDEDEFDQEKFRCRSALSELGRWCFSIIDIDPASVRRPYLPYKKELMKLFQGMTKQDPGEGFIISI